MRKRLHDELLEVASQQGHWLGFDQFMLAALTHPTEGYYSRSRGDGQPSGPFGPQGDFVTAPMLGPWLAMAISEAFQDLCRHADQQAPAWAQQGLSIREFGPGDGSLAADLLIDLAKAQRLPVVYEFVEVSPSLAALQRKTIALRLEQALGAAQASELIGRLNWLDQTQPSPNRWAGLVVANEVADALPVKRFEWRGPDQSVVEWGLAWQDAGWTWSPRPAQPDLAQAVAARRQAYRQARSDLPDWRPGHLGEWSPWLGPWARGLVEALDWGQLLILDYGYERVELDHADRSAGTLAGHLRHQRIDDPKAWIAEPGQMDLTAHVDFTALAETMAATDGVDLRLSSQARWLLDQGVLDRARSALFHLADPDALGQPPQDPARLAALAGLQTLLSDAAMGQQFLVLTASKGFLADEDGPVPPPA
jgi:SAM-dependent MidA family methyltransferase